MLIFKLIRKALFLSRLGIVEGGGGGASDDEQADVALADDDQQEGGEQDAGADDAAGEGDDKQDEGEKAGADGDADADADAAEVVVSIGDEQPPADEEDKAPEWVRDLRKQNREMARELRRRDAEIAGLKSGGAAEQETKAIDPGPEPTMAGCDFDADDYAAKLKAWMQRKAAADAQAEKARQAKEQQQAEWQGRLTAYAKSKAALKVRDMDDAEAAAQDALSTVQQGVILSAAENPALLIYALGKNPAKAKELAAIADPVKFAVAIGRLETKLKVQPRRTAPPPERVLQSNVPGAAGTPADLKRLEDEARRTGDYTKVLDFKRKQRAAKK